MTSECPLSPGEKCVNQVNVCPSMQMLHVYY